MIDSNDPAVYLPTNLNYLLSLYRSRPGALPMAGGTHIMKRSPFIVPDLGDRIIYLGNIDDLTRINRSDRHLDFGSCVPLQKMTEFAPSLLPRALRQCIDSIGTLSLRSTATVGGNVCVSSRYLGLLPALQLADTRVEVRSTGSSRWEPISRLINDESTIELERGEIITRFRLPSDVPRESLYRTSTDGTLSFTGFSDPQSDSLADVRIAVMKLGGAPIRLREVEAELIGRKIPLANRDMHAAIRICRQMLSTEDSQMNMRQRNCSVRLMTWFLQTITPTQPYD